MKNKMDNQKERYKQLAVGWLKELIAIPSLSGEEELAADRMERLLESYGYTPCRGGNNVWACSRHWHPEKPTILLDAHIDTVRPTGAWLTDPFEPVEKEGCLYGLGSNDTGGSVVSMLAAFLLLDERDQPHNLIYLCSAQEETTGTGGIQSVLGRLGPIDLALVGEPTGMHPAIAEKGLLVLDCVARGVAGHAARGEGVNAIYRALSDIDWFRSYRFGRESEWLGPVKMTVTGIQAGTQHNVVPAECRFTVDIRVNEQYSNSEVLELIRQHVQSEIHARSLHLNSSRLPREHSFVRRCEASGRLPYGSPTTSNQCVLSCPSLKIGPGDSARSHTANEFIRPAEIGEAIDLLVEWLDGYVPGKAE